MTANGTRESGRVATREGGVDRNIFVLLHILGVDRNRDVQNILEAIEQSPPARVAWIETCSR